MTPQHDNKVKILHIEGPGWREVYRVEPDGTETLIYAYSNRDKPHDVNEATAMTVVESMPWSEFCLRYQSNTKYAALPHSPV